MNENIGSRAFLCLFKNESVLIDSHNDIKVSRIL